MKIINHDLLRSIKEGKRCEFPECKRPATDPCHISARGSGDHKRLDVPIGVLAGCRECHSNQHATGRPARGEMYCIAAAREGMDPTEVEETIWRLQAAKKRLFCDCLEADAVKVGRSAWLCLGCGRDRPAPEIRKHLHEMLGSTMQTYEMPRELVQQHYDILVIAISAREHRVSAKIAEEKATAEIKRLMKKHLSDSPSEADKCRLYVDVLEHALKFAKGEIEL